MTETSNRKGKMTQSATARWSVMLLVSFVMATNYYFYDLLAPIQDLLRINLGFTASDFGLVMSAYAFPNVFLAMAVVGGIILDRLGIRLTGFSFIFLMAIGGGITAYAASSTFLDGGFGYALLNSFWPSYSPQLKMMVVGFFIFGLGAETSIVVLSKVIVKWFKGKELALALGLNLAIGRLGAALAFTITPRLVHPEWTTGIYFGVLLLWIGLLGFIVYMLVDYKVDKQESIDIKDPDDKFRLRDLGDLITNRSVIFITLLCVTFYSAVFPFLKFAPDLLMNKFAMARQMAGDVTSYLMYGTILLTPLFGWYADNRGKSATLMYLGSALLIIAHLMFALTYIEPRLPIVLLGVAFSLVPAAMWPAVTKIVPNSKLGTAYGFMFSVQNIGLFVFPMLIGWVVDTSNPHYRTELSTSKFAAVQQNNMRFQGQFLDRHNQPVAEKTIFASAVVFDQKERHIIWKESHQVKTDENGNYNLVIGKGEVLERVDFTNIMDTIEYSAHILTELDEEKETIYRGPLVYDESLNFTGKLKEALADGRHNATLKIYNPGNNEKVWEENVRLYVEDNVSFEIVLAYGSIEYANPKYFNLETGKHEAEIIKPLDYTNPMLVFAALGFFGLIFAFLLKKEDKTSGYGLEKPNKDME